MKTLILLLFTNLIIPNGFGQDTIRYDHGNTNLDPYWYENTKGGNTLKIASGISFATGGTLIAIGLIRSAANSAEVGMAKAGSTLVNISGEIMTVGTSYAAQSQMPAWDPVDYRDFNYNDSRSTKQCIISGSAFLGLGVLLALLDERAGSPAKRNSKNLYRYLRASSSRDGIGVTCKF